MSNIQDITDALASRLHGSLMDEKPAAKPASAPAQREYATGARSANPYQPSPASSGAPKVFPSDRMALRDGKASAVATPRRPAVLISLFSDSDLEWMLATPVKRGWKFEDWLEVIGLPRDLHEQHDKSIFGYAARAFLKLKREAHQR